MEGPAIISHMYPFAVPTVEICARLSTCLTGPIQQGTIVRLPRNVPGCAPPITAQGREHGLGLKRAPPSRKLWDLDQLRELLETWDGEGQVPTVCQA